MIAVIDYGMGNLRSVQKALEISGAKAKVTSDPRDIKKADKVVFPGVGAFGDAVKELKSRKLEKPLKDAISEGKPFLGLCLGLQLLFEKSEEAPGVKGLGIFKGDVKKFKFADRALKVPHMGWNNITKNARHKEGGQVKRKAQSGKIFKNVPDGSYMYFVHSYYVKPKDRSVIITETNYGIRFVSGIQKGNIYGFQFHPEKSQDVGLEVLKNFVSLR